MAEKNIEYQNDEIGEWYRDEGYGYEEGEKKEKQEIARGKC